MSLKILIFVCGEGLGHTGRCLAAGRELSRAGHEVTCGAYGYSAQFLAEHGMNVREVPAEIRLVGEKGSLNLGKSIKESIKLGQLPGLFDVQRLVDEEKPDVILSDSYYLGTIAALRRKIPVALMVNQSNMEIFFQENYLFQGLGKIAKEFYNGIFKRVDRTIIPDYPQPNTICDLNLNFEDESTSKVEYTGPLPARSYEDVIAQDLPRPHVLSLIGGFGYRAPIFRRIIEAASMDSTINYTLLSGPGLDKEELPPLPDNAELLPFIPDQFPYLKSCDLAIAPGGHTTMMEALAYGVPMLSFPDRGHSEQQNNAEGLEAKGCGKQMDYKASASEILESVREAVNGKYRDKTEQMKKLAREINGPENLRKILEDLAYQRL